MKSIWGLLLLVCLSFASAFARYDSTDELSVMNPFTDLSPSFQKLWENLANAFVKKIQESPNHEALRDQYIYTLLSIDHMYCWTASEDVCGLIRWIKNVVSYDPRLSSLSVKTTLEYIKKNSYIDGSPNARFTIIEYSDLECPFCKRHHQNGTIAKLIENYPDDVNHIFRHFPLISLHPDAQKLAEAAECAGSEKWSEWFYTFIDKIFTSIRDHSKQYGWLSIAEDLGYDMSIFTSCVENGTYTDTVNAQVVEGQGLFDVQGTPGNVLVDSETGKFVLIPGAHPYEVFEKELTKFLEVM